MNSAYGNIKLKDMFSACASYFYAVNILRNTHRLFPKTRWVKFLYYVLSFEIIAKIPALKGFQEHKDEVEESIKNKDE